MVTGYDEAVEVFHDSAAFSSCISVTGPFPGFPVPLDGDDVGELIERHRHELPMNDQLPTLDPPVHTAHRALLMKLITPKRLKENEASMWQLADRILDEFLAGGEGEFVSGFAGPFTLLVIADLLGVPEEDREEFLDMLQRRPRSGVIGSTGEDTLTHSPLELLYGRFTAYIEDSRRQPRGDVLTGLATATFPDGSVPEKGDRVVLNGWGVGETHWGGLAQRARLNGDWLVPLPPNFTAWHAMAIGTAGYTASLCVGALLDHGVRPDQGEILVTGATGGVGSIAVALLAKAGFTVAAATGKPSRWATRSPRRISFWQARCAAADRAVQAEGRRILLDEDPSAVGFVLDPVPPPAVVDRLAEFGADGQAQVGFHHRVDRRRRTGRGATGRAVRLPTGAQRSPAFQWPNSPGPT